MEMDSCHTTYSVKTLASQIDGDGNAINIIATQPSSGEEADDLQLLP